jgi:hypothetical protein
VAGLAVAAQRFHEICRVLSGQHRRDGVLADAVPTVAARASQRQHLSRRSVADRRRQRTGRRGLRGKVKREALELDRVGTAQHLLQCGRAAISAVVLGQCGQQIDRLLPGEARGAGRCAVAVGAMASGARRGARLAPFIGRNSDWCGGCCCRDRQARVVTRDVADIRSAQLRRHVLQHRVPPRANSVLSDRLHEIGGALPAQLRNPWRCAGAVGSVTTHTAALRDRLARSQIGGRFGHCLGFRALLGSASREREEHEHADR